MVSSYMTLNQTNIFISKRLHQYVLKFFNYGDHNITVRKFLIYDADFLYLRLKNRIDSFYRNELKLPSLKCLNLKQLQISN